MFCPKQNTLIIFLVKKTIAKRDIGINTIYKLF